MSDIEGEDLLRVFGCHPDQIKELQSTAAARLKSEPDQVLRVLRQAKKLSPELKQIRQQLEEVKSLTGSGSGVYLRL